MEGKIGRGTLSTSELSELRLTPISAMVAEIEQRKLKGEPLIYTDSELKLIYGVADYLAKREKKPDEYHSPLSLAIRGIVARGGQPITLDKRNTPDELYRALESWQQARIINNGGLAMDRWGNDDLRHHRIR